MKISRESYDAMMSYLSGLANAEYAAGLRAHKRLGRRARTYRHDPSAYHRDLVTLLGDGNERGFKALKLTQGYASILGV